jgi:hypothetical protein
VSPIAKRVIWRLESDRYALTTPRLFELGNQLPDYYRGNDPARMGYRVLESLRAEAWEKFAAMDMFFVKVSAYTNLLPHLCCVSNCSRRPISYTSSLRYSTFVTSNSRLPIAKYLTTRRNAQVGHLTRSGGMTRRRTAAMGSRQATSITLTANSSLRTSQI